MKLLKGKKEQEALLRKKVAHQALKSSLTGFFEMEAARGEGAGYVPWIMWLDAEPGDFAQKMPDSLARRQHEVFFTAAKTASGRKLRLEQSNFENIHSQSLKHAHFGAWPRR